MALNNLTNQQAKMNYEHLCELQNLLGIACILHLLDLRMFSALSLHK